MPKLQFHLRRGLDIPLSGPPRPEIHAASQVGSVAVLPGDFPGMKLNLLVEEGHRVALGEPLLADRADPRLRLTSPGAGVVATIHRGPKRALRSIVIELDGAAETTFAAVPHGELGRLSREAVHDRLLESGLWAALRSRPYGRVPLPDATPHALFVTAMDTNPVAPDPRILIGEYGADFADGIEILAALLDGQVYVCCGPGPDLKLPAHPRVSLAEFAGPHPAGLPGTHIHSIAPVSAHRSAWYVGYQDAIAIGRLFTTGRISPERVISLAGPAVLQPRLVRTRLGASIDDLVRNETAPGECRVLSGSVLAGRPTSDWAAYLGRYHNQVTVLHEGREREFLGWTMPGADKFSVTRTFLSGFLPKRLFPLGTNQLGRPRAMIPIGTFEHVMPLDILPTQLLRAIAVGDTDAAQLLGCLELEEEDLALCSFVCPSKYDYGPLLRQALARIEKEG
ncbi:MAG: Na+-transporting NADH:ubiquinone oxidoreductase subunit [Pseudomonadota bacterium]|jgi:Na+-transporting NADH:ubiquinone oxidoreductase subunit A|nr:Na+-transporting NADH:ubiquinone oxidoreductase subunit [Pseudomonadota bacterium]